MNLAPHSGTYALLLYAHQESAFPIGRDGCLGRLTLRPGFYVYVGSAFGPGGVAGRVRRHLDPAAPVRWHVDYLKPYMKCLRVWYTFDPVRRECSWANLVQTLPGAGVPLAGFGSSDCRCRAHLFAFAACPSFRGFTKKIQETLADHAPVFALPLGFSVWKSRFRQARSAPTKNFFIFPKKQFHSSS